MTDTFGIKKINNAFHILYRELGLSLKGVCSLRMLSSLTAKQFDWMLVVWSLYFFVSFVFNSVKKLWIPEGKIPHFLV